MLPDFERLGVTPVERAMLEGYQALYERPHLRDVRVNVPFRVEVAPGLELAGECDAVGTDTDGRTVVVEHKTTTSDITPGSQYWRKVVLTDPQVSIYSIAFPGATVLYDVLHVPQFRAGDLYAKSLAAMAETPEKYFQRMTVVRMAHEADDTVQDVRKVEGRMATDAEVGTARNPDACFTYGRECDFFAACWEGREITTYPTWEGSENADVVKERWGQ